MLPGEALDRPHVARRRASTAQAIVIEMVVAAGRRDHGVRRVPRDRPQPRQARLQQRRRVARRHGARPGARRSPCRGWTSSSASRTASRSCSASAGSSTARSPSRRSRPAPCSTTGRLADLVPEGRNRAKDLIEDFMIAANGVTARYPRCEGVPVAAPRAPLPRAMGEDRRPGRVRSARRSRPSRRTRALEAFLIKRREADPVALRRSLALGREAPRARRVRPRAPGPASRGPLRARASGLHALDGARIAASPTSSRSAC